MQSLTDQGPAKSPRKFGLVLSGPVFVIILVLFAGLYLLHRRANRVTALPETQLASTTGKKLTTICNGKQRCVLAYIAPWCPTCNADLPRLLDLRARMKDSPDLGMAFVIGWDDQDALQREADKIGGDIFFDGNKSLAEALHVWSVPTFFVIDGAGRILQRSLPLPDFRSMSAAEWQEYRSKTLGG